MQRTAVNLALASIFAGSLFACSDSKTDDTEAFDPSTAGSTGGNPNGTTAGANAGTGGNSQAGTGSASGNCEEHDVAATLATPDMLIVLDRSGSMNPESNDDETDRWSGSRDAVIQVTADYDDQIRFGLMTFPAFQAGGGGGFGGGGNQQTQCAPGTVNVPIDLGQGDMIASALEMMNASGRTPTAPSLAAALPVIGDGATPGPDVAVPPKFVLLVTDGDPNCSAGGSGSLPGRADPVARMETIAAIEALTAQNVKTYVVGFQTAGTDFEAQLDMMAAAGGTGETKHQSVASAADLTATFSQLAAGVVSCSFTLDAPVVDPSYVLVTVGGTPRGFNKTADGWTLDSKMQTVTLTGQACEDVKNGSGFSVAVKCTAVPVI